MDRTIQRLSQTALAYDEIIFMTSATFSSAHKDIIRSETAKQLGVIITLIDRDEILNLLKKYNKLSEKYLNPTKTRLKHQYIAISFGLIMSLLSIFGLSTSLTRTIPRTELSKQVDAVEVSLKNIKQLETNLREIKNDLQNKVIESERIKLQYNEAMKLKNITNDQLSQIRIAINRQSKVELIVNYFLGFVLGVFSSIIASIILDRLRRNKLLKRDSV